MLYTVATHFRLKRSYCVIEQIEARTSVNAKKAALQKVLTSHPKATHIHQRAKRSQRFYKDWLEETLK